MKAPPPPPSFLRGKIENKDPGEKPKKKGEGWPWGKKNEPKKRGKKGTRRKNRSMGGSFGGSPGPGGGGGVVP